MRFIDEEAAVSGVVKEEYRQRASAVSARCFRSSRISIEDFIARIFKRRLQAPLVKSARLISNDWADPSWQVVLMFSIGVFP